MQPPITDPSLNACGTVLLVEDDVLTRIYLGEELRAAGFTLIDVASGHEALVVLTELDTIGLVITDVDMPGTINGIALANWLITERPYVKMVMLSGHLSTDEMAELAGLADLALQKPLSSGIVVQQVKELVAETGGKGPRVFRENR